MAEAPGGDVGGTPPETRLAVGIRSVGGIGSVVVMVTAGCNLRCRYCYVSRKPRGHVRWAAVEAAFDRARSAGALPLRVAFTGGEPLMHFPLVRLAAGYLQPAGSEARPIELSLTTNGLGLRPTVVDFLDARGFRVDLSFDGVPAAQALRGRDTFARLERLLERLRRDHRELFDRRLRVLVTITPRTVSFLADSIDYLVGKGVRTITVSPAMKQSGWQAERIEALDRGFERAFDRLVERYEETGEVPLTQFRKTGAASPERPGEGAWLCAAPTGRTIAVDVDGTACTCLLATSSYQRAPVPSLRPAIAALRVGRPDDPGFEARLASVPAAAAASGVFQHDPRRRSCYGRCAECEWLGRCRVCPLSAACEPASRDPHRVNDFMCAFNRVVLKYRARFPRQPGTAEILAGRAPVPRAVRRVLEAAGPPG